MRARDLLSAAALSLLGAACAPTPIPGSIGVVARREAGSGRIVVIRVPAGGAGARAGLEVGDEIVAVDRQPVASMTPDDFHRAVRGPVGSRVVLKVRRDGALHDVGVERAALKEIAAQPESP